MSRTGEIHLATDEAGEGVFGQRHAVAAKIAGGLGRTLWANWRAEVTGLTESDKTGIGVAWGAVFSDHAVFTIAKWGVAVGGAEASTLWTVEITCALGIGLAGLPANQRFVSDASAFATAITSVAVAARITGEALWIKIQERRTGRAADGQHRCEKDATIG